VLNVALGTEYYFNKNWAIRGGVFTDYANTPRIDPALILQDEHIDLYGASLSLSFFTRNTSITLGGNVSLGNGKSQSQSGSVEIQDVRENAWTLFLSSSYTY
jgi:long-chain fatty acid transport protein